MRFLSPSGSTRATKLESCGPRFALCVFWLIAGMLSVGSSVRAEITAGDILVADQIGGTNSNGALFLVNPTTGQRTVFSDFGDPAQGDLLNSDVVGVAVGGGRIFVSALFSGGASEGGALFEIDPETGNRTLLSDLSQGDIQGYLYYGLALDTKGRVLANLDRYEPRTDKHRHAVVRVDPETDQRNIVTDLTKPRQGDTAAYLTDLTLESSGRILMATDECGLFDPTDAKIIRVRPINGQRKLVSDFADPSQGTDVGDLCGIGGLAVDASGSGSIYVTIFGFSPTESLLLRIDPKTGQRTVLSDFDDPTQGALGAGLFGVAVEGSGEIIVSADGATGASLLLRIDPETGQRTVLSDSADRTQGPALSNGLVDIAIVPNTGNDQNID